MNDRELLEFAAKAVGIVGVYRENGYRKTCGISASMDAPLWNPLRFDGDALRLAVQLGMLVDVRYGEGVDKNISVTYWITPMNGNCIEIQGEPYATTRRAIVRAAAEIGKEMK